MTACNVAQRWRSARTRRDVTGDVQVLISNDAAMAFRTSNGIETVVLDAHFNKPRRRVRRGTDKAIAALGVVQIARRRGAS